MKLAPIMSAASALLISACVSNPPMTYRYMPATGFVSVTVIESLACDSNDKVLYRSIAPPTITPGYQAAEGDAWTVTIQDANRNVANTDFTFTRWDDGRLKGINSVATGQGAEIIKAAIAVVGAVVGAGAPSEPTDGKICTELKAINKDGTVAITYTRTALFSEFPAPSAGDLSADLSIPEGSSSSEIFGRLQKLAHFDQFNLTLKRLNTDLTPAKPVTKPSENDYIMLDLQKVELGELSVTRRGAAIASVKVLIPSPKKEDKWQLPIPRAKAFGKSTFAVTLAESGIVTSIQYAKDTGSTNALGAAGALGDAATHSQSEKLAALKLEDDVIAENNRHVQCLAQKPECK